MLRKAVSRGNRRAVQTMIELDFDVNAVDRWTGLHEAALGGDLDLIRLLLEAGADPKRGNLEQLKARLDEDPSRVNRKFASIRPAPEKRCDADWPTPLANAAMNAHADTVHCLLERGADPNIQAQHGNRLLQMVNEQGHT